jgi:hypothetical protein
MDALNMEDIEIGKHVRQITSFIEISTEAGILLGGKHEACFVLGVAGMKHASCWGWQELNPCCPDQIGRDTAFALCQLG